MKKTLRITQGSSPMSVSDAVDITLKFSEEIGVDSSVEYDKDGAVLFIVDVVDNNSFALVGAMYMSAKRFGMNVEEV